MKAEQKIKAAMTPAEWARLLAPDGSMGLRSDGSVWIAPEADECEEPLAAAALLLHALDLFTWDDVDATRYCADVMESLDVGWTDPRARAEFVAHLRRHANKLESLLPPREET